MVRGPARRHHTGLVQGPGADRADHADFLGDPDELGRRDVAALAVGQAQQGLETMQAAIDRRDQRLEVQFEPAVAAGIPDRLLEVAARLELVLHVLAEQHGLTAAKALGVIERHIGRAHQVLDLGRAYAHADAGRDGEGVARQHEGHRHVRDDGLGQGHGVGRIDIVDTGDDEFVAADPPDHVVVPQALAQTGHHRLDQLVTGGMTEAVVDLLEPVDVDIEQRDIGAAAGLF